MARERPPLEKTIDSAKGDCSPMSADVATARALADVLKQTGLGEIALRRGNFRLRVSAATPTVSPSVAPPPAAGPAVPATETKSQPEGDMVTSPMVGTVYLSQSPGADPFVKVGDDVAKGQTLLIIEAMKVMNNIPSPRDGTVKAVLAGNGQPVEYGETLVVIA